VTLKPIPGVMLTKAAQEYLNHSRAWLAIQKQSYEVPSPMVRQPDGVHFTIPGEPATKKTSQRIVRAGKRMLVIPSQRTLAWTAGAQVVMRLVMADAPPLVGEVGVHYIFYRQKNVADLGGMEAALDDAMQGIVIVNDRQIVNRTSRRLRDGTQPRVEVWVYPLAPVTATPAVP
jgi:Holliday junction resolvase RusA-like endonuclease